MDTGTEHIWSILETISDPEVPVLTITDLGIIRDVVTDDFHTEITITPTYSGCPAMNQIESDIRETLGKNGYSNLKISTVLSPAWTTDWMSEQGKEKLRQYGIAPPSPVQPVCRLDLFAGAQAIECPRCRSYHTELISQFGSTACKALYKCLDCLEPFDYFKCH